jgi:hypothetical protein
MGQNCNAQVVAGLDVTATQVERWVMAVSISFTQSFPFHTLHTVGLYALNLSEISELQYFVVYSYCIA